MALFLIHVMDMNGGVVYYEKTELPCNTVEQALQSKKVKDMKRDAKFEKLAFRVKLLEE